MTRYLATYWGRKNIRVILSTQPLMVLAILFSLTIVSAGYAVIRTSGAARGALGLGLTAPVGVALLTFVASWCVLLGAPSPLPAVAVWCMSLAGLALAIADRRALGIAIRKVFRERKLPSLTLFAALAVPLMVQGFAFAGAVVPFSPHDGAAHTEAIQAYRLGQTWIDWYPPGLRTLFAAWLQAMPWVDSAQGALDLGISLPLLAAVAIFGLGVAVWRNSQMAAAGALLLSLTYVYPYFPQIWSGWPLASSLVLLVGLWAVSLEYVRRPSVRWGVLAGLLLGALILVHGSELYSVALVLPVILLAGVRRVVWRVLPRDIGVAAVVALVCAAPYLPTLFHWVGTGGTGYGVSVDASQAPQGSPGISAASDLFVVFGLGALGIDLPLRLVLLAVGVFAAFRMRTGRSVVVIGLVFLAITSTFTLLGGYTLVRQVYGVTFPWGMHYRIFMIIAMCQALLAGAGGVVVLRWLDRYARRPTAWGRRVGRLVRVLGVTWLVVATWSMTLFVAYPAGLVLGYSADDAVAMDWLRQHAAAGSLVVNDGYADAGIWTPYKAGLPILLPRSASADEQDSADLIIDNIARLDQVPAAAAEACAREAEYVYYGARVSAWDTRRFPPLADLRASPALEEVFASGEAVVFRLRLTCGST